MKKFNAFLLVFCILLVNVTGLSAEEEPVSIFVAGDSTAASYEAAVAPLTGWAQVLHEFLPSHIKVENHAVSGKSAKSFVDEGRLDAIADKISKGDYLLIQFGHNDQKIEDQTRYTNPESTFKDYLKRYIEKAKLKGAIPILVTPIERRRFSDGKAQPTLTLYAEAMKKLASDEGVTVIDLSELSLKLYDFLGEENSKQLFMILQPGDSPNYPGGITDNTHLCDYGAREITKVFLSELSKTSLPIAKYVKDVISPLPSDKADKAQNTAAAYANEENYVKYYEQALEELAARKIITDSENADRALTRAEFSTMLVRALSLETVGEPPVFYDVPQNHWAADNIAAVCTNNILSGYDDTRFGPDDAVTFEQAAKVFVEILGYGEQANNKAPYPWGYLIEAACNGITANTNAVAGDALTRGQAAVLLCNSFFALMPSGDVLADRIFGKTYFVSVNGSDLNDGSYGKPWKSLKKAAETLKKGETVIFESGEYREEDAVRFLNSGTQDRLITVRTRTPGEVDIIFEGSGIEIPAGCNYIRIEGFNISSASANESLISCMGDYSLIKGCSFKMEGLQSVYSEGTNGIVIQDNTFKGAGISLKGVTNALIRNNEISDAVNAGVALSGASKNAQIYNNRIYSKKNKQSAALSLEDAFNSIIFNNVIVSHASGLIEAGIECINTSGCHAYNNIFIDTHAGACFKGSNEKPVFKNNIFSECVSDAYVYETAPAGLISDYNIFYKTYPFIAEKNSKYKNPGFIDKYSDWHVGAGSPAVGAGIVIPPEFAGYNGEVIKLDLRDLDGEKREGPWNIGVYNTVSGSYMIAGEEETYRPGVALLSESFDAENADWVISTGTWKIEGGVCRQTDPEAARSIITYSPGHEWKNYEFSANVKAPPATKESTTGIIFGADKEVQNMYAFRLYENAQLEICKWVRGQFLSLDKWDYSISPGKVYNLKVKAVGNKFTFYVDDVFVREFTDDSYSEGTVGLYAFKQIGEFDNVKVITAGTR